MIVCILSYSCQLRLFLNSKNLFYLVYFLANTEYMEVINGIGRPVLVSVGRYGLEPRLRDQIRAESLPSPQK